MFTKNSFVITILLSLILYFYVTSLTVDIFGGDVGDLVTAAFVRGVAHPPGYPLFTILGFFVSHLNLDLETVTKVGLISALASITALYVYSKIIELFTQNRLIQIISVGSLAFSYHFWLYSVIPEVFALNSLLSLCVIYNSLAFYKYEKFRNLGLITFFVGLGLSNHMTILLFLPFVVGIIINKRKRVISYRRKLFLLPLFFVIGLLPYVYIPIAASANPIISWDDAKNLDNFIHLVFRRDYGTFSAGIFPRPALELRSFLLKNYFTSIISSLSAPVIVISLLGVVNFVRKEKYLGTLLCGLILLVGPLFVVYAAFPITNSFGLATVERFYLLSEVVIGLFLPWGLLLIFTFFGRIFSKKIYAFLLLFMFILIPILLFIKNYPKTNLSKLSLGNEFGKNYLRNLPENSVLIVEGDTKSFNTWYMHFVKNIRPDVELIEIGNFAVRNDFFKPLFEKTIKETKKDEITSFFITIEKVAEKRPVFATTPININNNDYVWLPRGIGYQLIRKDKFPKIEDYRKLFPSDFENINVPERGKLKIYERNLISSDIPTYYADSFVRIGDIFYNYYADFSAAAKYYKYATIIDPEFSKGYAGKSRVASQYGNCKDSELDIKKAIDLYPIEKSYYYFWYFNALNCFKDKNKMQIVNDYFTNTFHEDIKKSITKDLSK